MDVICGASKHAVRIAQELSKVPSVPSASGVAAGAPRGRPRCVLNLRALQGRSADGAADGAATAESYADLVRRMRVEVLLLLERLPRSVLVICPGEDVRRVLFAHFCGCSEKSIADLEMPSWAVLELTRDHKGYSCEELELQQQPRHSLSGRRLSA
eukprot:g21316.t1